MLSTTEIKNIDKILISAQLSFKTLRQSKKWLIYVVLSLIPLLYTLLVQDKLLGASNGMDAFFNFLMGTHFYIFFGFGCLIIALPISSDELSDNTIDFFIVRPIPREFLYLTRYAVLIGAITIVNFLIALVYFIFYQLNDWEQFSSKMIENILVLPMVIVFFFIVGIFYASLFLVIGFVGRDGLTVGLLIAIIDLLFSTIEIQSIRNIMPKVHAEVIASELFGSFYTLNKVNPPDLTTSLLTLGLYALALLLIGVYSFKTKEIK